MSGREGWVLRVILLVVAVALFGVAFYFGPHGPPQESPAGRTGLVCGEVTLGFALAAGLALLAAALVKSETR